MNTYPNDIENPQVGDKRRARGYTDIWVACPVCGGQRWVRLDIANKSQGRCRHCGGLRSKQILPIYDENNPQIGDKRRGKHRTEVWIACPDCGKERWLWIQLVKRTKGRCQACANSSRRKVLPPYDKDNPQIGDKRKNGGHTEIWMACIICGKQRWVSEYDSKIKRGKCVDCAKFRDLAPYDENNPKTGDRRRILDAKGIPEIQIFATCPKCGRQRWMPEHYFNKTPRKGLCVTCSNNEKQVLPTYEPENPQAGDKRRIYREATNGGKGRPVVAIYTPCPKCGKLRWVENSQKRLARCCPKCANKGSFAKGAEHSSWKGGRIKDSKGYIKVYTPGHPYANKGHYVFEHRLVMEKMIGRYLLPGEIVHHRNGIRDDNSEINLQLMSSRKHSQVCQECGLKKEVRMLRWQIKELREALQLKLGEQFGKEV